LDDLLQSQSEAILAPTLNKDGVMAILLVILKFYAVAAVVLFLVVKTCSYLLRRFVLITDRRQELWSRCKCVLYIVGALPCIFGGFYRIHYFHDQMQYASKKYLNMAYANQMSVELYLMDHQNLIDLFEGNPPNPNKQFIDEEEAYRNTPPLPEKPRFYLVARLKNTGDRVAWGVLDYAVNGISTRMIDVPPLPAHMTDFKLIVLPTNRPDRYVPGEYPVLASSWNKLFINQGASP